MKAVHKLNMVEELFTRSLSTRYWGEGTLRICCRRKLQMQTVSAGQKGFGQIHEQQVYKSTLKALGQVVLTDVPSTTAVGSGEV